MPRKSGSPQALPAQRKGRRQHRAVGGRPQPSRRSATAFQIAISRQEGPCEEDPQPLLDLGSLLAEEGRAEVGLPYLGKAGALALRNAKCQEQLRRIHKAEATEQCSGQLPRAVQLAPNR